MSRTANKPSWQPDCRRAGPFLPPSHILTHTAIKIIGTHRGGQSIGSHPASRRRSTKGAQLEAQGATSWSSDDLRVKYRAEREREEAYQAFRLEEQVAEALEQDYGQASDTLLETALLMPACVASATRGLHVPVSGSA